ncbi:DnaJ domain, conserved site [Phytophthora cactorum]|nr:DnaJ domain, conserved site [Phytophthora cactorum]
MAAALIHAEFGTTATCTRFWVWGARPTKRDHSAYRKLALKYHPDKQRGDEASCAKATAKFQAVSAIHSILSDKEARAVYDESGTILSDDHDDKSPSFQMWTQYFARVFPRFEGEYRHSDEEKRDVLAAYTKYEGEMQHIMDTISCEGFPYLARVRQGAVQEDEKERDPAEQKRKQAKREKEAREAEELFNKIRGNQQKRGEGSGSNSTQYRKRGFESLLGSLEAKYAEKGKKSKRKAAPRDSSEPSEEEFLAAQKRLKRSRKK